MKPLAAEWIAKADADVRTARRELRARVEPNFDAVCFHAQQAAEKYLKAACVEAGIDFPRTHDVAALLALLAPSSLALVGLDEPANLLASCAVEVRYPGRSSDREDAREALKAAEAIRSAARQNLGLPESS
jgi:HEPN domain-containing protein